MQVRQVPFLQELGGYICARSADCRMVWLASATNSIFSGSIKTLNEAAGIVWGLVVDSVVSFLAVFVLFFRYFKETLCLFLCMPLLCPFLNKCWVV